MGSILYAWSARFSASAFTLAAGWVQAMTDNSKTIPEPELTTGGFVANRIRYLITMMMDVQRDDIRFANYNPQAEIEKLRKKLRRPSTAKSETTLRRVWLWLRIVGRENWSDRLTGPKLAWEIARIIWP
jgi:hypothetical protein